jgi:putative N6-adenine-specific DNA methylase
MQIFQYTAKTFQGLEAVLARELNALGARDIRILKRAVGFSGDKAVMYKSNYLTRTALQILRQIAVFEVSDVESLYQNTKKIPWTDYMSVENTFAVNSVSFSEEFHHAGFVSLKVKDAIADYFREKFGNRPSVSVDNPDIGFEVHIAGTRCTVSLDTSGEQLFKRGYRIEQGIAPLKEVLAAGMLQLTDFLSHKQLIDPMCGSATLLIEAAMAALNIPAGKFRKSYAFEKFNDFDSELFQNIKEKALAQIKTRTDLKISGSDIDRMTVVAARRNIKNAGLEEFITLETKDFFETQKTGEQGIIIMNPPYDIRIKTEFIETMYDRIGTKLKHEYNGYEAWILSGHADAVKKIGLKPTFKIELFNGPVKCSYQKFSLYSGSKKTNRSTEIPAKPVLRKKK